jgi:geranylgeranyl diphosphate synthase type II
VFGKTIGGDITSNKKTYMLINAVNRANEEQRRELTRWIEATDFNRDEKVSAVTALYDQIGIRQLCEQKINYYFDECRKYLDRVSVPDERKAMLLDYTNEMMKRNK